MSISYTHTHRHTHASKLLSTHGMCMSDFAALCWVMPWPVPQNSSFASNNSLLVQTQLADPWASQADVTATKQRPVSVSLATPFLIFLRNGELEDRVTSQWQGRLLKVLSDSVCAGVESVKNWEWMTWRCYFWMTTSILRSRKGLIQFSQYVLNTTCGITGH